MGKLMKYEFRKQLKSKVVVGILTVLIEIAFLYGILADKEEWISGGLAFMILLTFIGLFYFSFETVLTYSNDLKTKQSYMLFLTPRSMYQIVGAKMLTTVVQIIGGGIFFATILIGDVLLVFSQYSNVELTYEFLRDLFAEIGLKIGIGDIAYYWVLFLITWLEFVVLAIFAITLSTTFFANKKYKGVMSLVIYFVLNFFLNRVANILSNGYGENEIMMISLEGWIYIGIYTFAMILLFFGTTWLLEKKVSV